jgi:hypothetical protein
VVEDFQETILILEPMKSTEVAQKKKTKQKERLETKQPDWKFDFQRARISKIEKRNQGFRSSKNCTRAIVHGRKVPDNDISKKQKNSKSIIRLKTEKNAGLSFLLK